MTVDYTFITSKFGSFTIFLLALVNIADVKGYRKFNFINRIPVVKVSDNLCKKICSCCYIIFSDINL
jgi:hypothetical protein